MASRSTALCFSAAVASRRQASRFLVVSCDGRRSDVLCSSLAAKLLGPPTSFNAAKLKVEFVGENMSSCRVPAAFPRAYTLTHCDFTANLTLAVSDGITGEQLRSWQTTLQRDDVFAEWKDMMSGEMTLHVHCYVSGANLLQDLAAGFRYYVFSKELPLVLKAVVYGDAALFAEQPELMEAKVWVHFHSASKKYNRIECWGPLKEASKEMLQRFTLFYNGFESRPVFDTVEDMLKWSGLYELTRRTLEEELVDAGLNSQTISELVTVITRINYGQSVSISGLAGAVSLAGSESGLWAVKGGNWQLAAGLLKTANATLHLQEGIDSISDAGDYYVLKSNKGHEYNCKVTVVATPLDEVNITFSPPISIPPRKMQHTHATFVRGLLNHKFFGLSSVSDIPELIGTLELPDIPFSCISVLKKYSEHDMTYKVFSRVKLDDSSLDQMFSTRKETIRINWPAYPHYEAPEDFAPIILDGKQLYYVNTFESAASAMETGAVAAENVARLIISRLPLPPRRAGALHFMSFAEQEEESRRVDL